MVVELPRIAARATFVDPRLSLRIVGILNDIDPIEGPLVQFPNFFTCVTPRESFTTAHALTIRCKVWISALTIPRAARILSREPPSVLITLAFAIFWPDQMVLISITLTAAVKAIAFRAVRCTL